MEIKIKMDRTEIIVFTVVGSLGLLSAIFGFAAEGAKNTRSYSNPSRMLGICATIWLLSAQVIASVVSCCCKYVAGPSKTKRTVGVVCAVFSWIAAVVAWALFGDRVFAGGAVFALVATALGIASFLMRRRLQPSDTVGPAPDAAAELKPREQQQPSPTVASPYMDGRLGFVMVSPSPSPSGPKDGQQQPPKNSTSQQPVKPRPQVQVRVEVRSPSAATRRERDDLPTIIRKEAVKEGIRKGFELFERCFFSNNNTGDDPEATTVDSTGCDVGVTDYYENAA